MMSAARVRGSSGPTVFGSLVILLPTSMTHPQTLRGLTASGQMCAGYRPHYNACPSRFIPGKHPSHPRGRNGVHCCPRPRGKGFFIGTPEDKNDRRNGDEEFREMGGRRRRRVGPAYRLIVAGRREARLREGREQAMQLLPRGEDGRQGLHGRREVLRQESHPEGIRGGDEGAGEGRAGTRRDCGKERGAGVDGDGGQGVSLPVRLPSLPGGVPERLPASARKGRDTPDEGEDDGAS